jgi:hypothetical protein
MLRIVALVGLAMLPGQAIAQTPPSIQETSVAPYFASGRLQGCSANFEITQRDPLYNENAPVHLSGSFQVYDFGQARVVAVLKLGLFYGGQSFEAPTGAYLVDGFRTSVEDATEDLMSETPGFRLFGFRLGEVTALAIGSLAGFGELSFAYERGGGQSAVPVKMILQEDAQRQAWSDCFETLVETYR